MKLTHRLQLLNLLSDKKWHSFQELNAICYRYGARLKEIRDSGYELDKKREDKVWYYILIAEPIDKS